MASRAKRAWCGRLTSPENKNSQEDQRVLQHEKERRHSQHDLHGAGEYERKYDDGAE
jgi:hypothetical protein